MTKSKIVIRTQYKLSLNNPDRLKTFKDKDQKYVDGVIDYFSDDSKRALNLIDYFTGKINKHEDINLIMENGKYATPEEKEKRKRYISKQFNNSNLWQIVLSIPKDLVDKNISWEDMDEQVSKKIIPEALKRMGFKDIKNMTYGMSRHMNTNNPHYHIYFMEKKPNTLRQNKTLGYRRKGKIPRKVINYIKNETVLTIQRQSKFKPMSMDINKDIDEFKKYFDPKTRNFVLYDKENVILEDKILRLGKLLDERDISYNSRIKFNSIKDDEIKQLTRDIKEDLFKKNKNLIYTKDDFNKRIDNMNNYLTSVAKNNGLKKSDIDLSYTNNKEKYLDNYILNAIVNHSRYHYRKNKKLVIDSNDIVQAIILNNYRKNKNYSKKNIVTNSLTSKTYMNKTKIRNAVRNINDEMEKASEEFSKLFDYGKERSDSL